MSVVRPEFSASTQLTDEAAPWAQTYFQSDCDVRGFGQVAAVASSGSYIDLTDKPAAVSSFSNDRGYLVQSDGAWAAGGKAGVGQPPAPAGATLQVAGSVAVSGGLVAESVAGDGSALTCLSAPAVTGILPGPTLPNLLGDGTLRVWDSRVSMFMPPGQESSDGCWINGNVHANNIFCNALILPPGPDDPPDAAYILGQVIGGTVVGGGLLYGLKRMHDKWKGWFPAGEEIGSEFLDDLRDALDAQDDGEEGSTGIVSWDSIRKRPLATRNTGFSCDLGMLGSLYTSGRIYREPSALGMRAADNSVHFADVTALSSEWVLDVGARQANLASVALPDAPAFSGKWSQLTQDLPLKVTANAVTCTVPLSAPLHAANLVSGTVPVARLPLGLDSGEFQLANVSTGGGAWEVRAGLGANVLLPAAKLHVDGGILASSVSANIDASCLTSGKVVPGRLPLGLDTSELVIRTVGGDNRVLIGMSSGDPGSKLTVMGNVSADYFMGTATRLEDYNLIAANVPFVNAGNTVMARVGASVQVGAGNVRLWPDGNVSCMGTLSASWLEGNGSEIIGLDASKVATGVLSVNRLPTLPVDKVRGLAPVATSGSYADLQDKPNISNQPDGSMSVLGPLLGLGAGTALAIGGQKIYDELGRMAPRGYEALEEGLQELDSGRDDDSKTKVMSYFNLKDRPLAVRLNATSGNKTLGLKGHLCMSGTIATAPSTLATAVGDTSTVFISTDPGETVLDIGAKTGTLNRLTCGTLAANAAGTLACTANLASFAGKVCVGNAAPTEALSVGGGCMASYFVGSGTGLTGLTGAQIGDGSLYVGNTRVGVGTAAPTEALTVAGNVAATGFKGNGALLTALSASALASGTVPAARLPNGIGDGSIQVADGTVTLAAAPLNFSNQLQNNIITLYGSTKDPASTFRFGFGVNPGTLRYDTPATSDTHRFYSGGTNYATIGSAGIQTAGNVAAAAFVGSGAQLTGLTGAQIGDGSLFVGGGRVGVGTTAPAQALSVAGNVSATNFLGNGSQLTGIVASQVGDGSLYVGGGRVGIGTTAPAQALDVRGNVVASGGLTLGDVAQFTGNAGIERRLATIRTAGSNRYGVVAGTGDSSTRLFAADSYYSSNAASTVCLSFATGEATYRDVLTASRAGGVAVQGGLTASRGLQVTDVDPGALVEKRYAGANDRYGVGQYWGGATRLYAANAFGTASVSLGFATGETTFNDVIQCQQNGYLRVGVGSTAFTKHYHGCVWVGANTNTNGSAVSYAEVTLPSAAPNSQYTVTTSVSTTAAGWAPYHSCVCFKTTTGFKIAVWCNTGIGWQDTGVWANYVVFVA